MAHAAKEKAAQVSQLHETRIAGQISSPIAEISGRHQEHGKGDPHPIFDRDAQAVSLAPGRNAETFEAPLSAAKAIAVLKAAASASGCETARGPIWPLLLT